ncbi:HNH endonuclease [Streptomyces noursei]|uniref:HNH endonuclease n=1 Tax=Streptomyces noursei TaxID=1971 RepID=UPI0035DF3AE3
MAVSKRLRYEILRRDSHTCRYCGATAPDVPLRIDHVTPVALGGADTPDNLVTACQDCNSGKSSSSPDAEHVTDVSSDALRWSAAMAQAAEELRSQAEPKRTYRAAFHNAWNEWTREHNGKMEPLDLPAGWKTSLDTFREAGLPIDVWPDIVEKTMTNKAVRTDNLFRYTCGIAWRMIRELQDRAKEITGLTKPAPASVDSVLKAAVEVWTREQFGEIGSDALDKFRNSAARLAEREDAYRVLHAAQHAAWFAHSDAAIALRDVDRDDAFQQWNLAWLTTAGEYPDEKRARRVQVQIETLLDADVYVGRIARAASYAGSRHTTYLHFGLGGEEQRLIGSDGYFVKALELWSEAFQTASGRWPEMSDRSAFLKSLESVANDGGLWIADVYPAAAAAGAYQDPNITTCMTRHLSVFEVAGRPVGGEN